MVKARFWVGGLVVMVIVYFLTLRPSFNLALTGDDYLGLWRYDFYLNGWGGEKLSNWAYFFTDYGPMDMVTAVIHRYFGFKHQVYYLFAFVLRLAAALSFLWPVYRLTRNRWASLGAAAFFSITTTGLEATDWSFNMPSYVAIAITNTLLGMFVVSRTRHNLWVFLALAGLFTLAIVAQPIRMMFLPLLMIGLEIYWTLTSLSWKNMFLGLSRIGLYSLLTAAILKYTSYGEAVSLRGNQAIARNYQQVVQLVKDKNYPTLVSPISQIGRIVLPNDFMYQRIEVWGLPRAFRRAVLPAYGLFLVGLVIFGVSRRRLVGALLLAAVWTGYVWQTFMQPTGYLLQPFELLTYLWGGYLLVSLGLWWSSSATDKNLKLGIVLSLLLLVGGFILFWVRTPGFLHEITGRYLIVPGAGLAWLMAMLLAVKTVPRQKAVLVLLFGSMLSLHAKVSYKYLNHLSEVRGIELTTRLRESVTRPKNYGDPKISQVFYFEGDNPEIIYHAFIFGWPVVSYYQYGGSGAWYNIAPTDNWQEVVSAYQDGESLKRFMPGPYGPVAPENIHAYRLREKVLYDVSEEKRDILRDLE